jgi:endonuclease G
MLRTFLATALLSLSTAAFAVVPSQPLAACTIDALYGLPTTVKQNTTKICRSGYVLEHDNVHHIPVWVAYVLTPQEATGCYPREGRFVPEPDLPEGASAKMKDYAKSGYDIGHMANDGDMRWSELAEEESNIFANATPQLPEFNRGIWKKLEDGTRGWAISRGHPLQIYIAPVVKPTARTIGESLVPVPNAFVKILVDTVTKEYQVFLFKHRGSKENLSTFITSLANAQQQTGVIFPLPTGAVASTSLWKVDMKSARAAKSDVCNVK